jgi:hypothetical protein
MVENGEELGKSSDPRTPPCDDNLFDIGNDHVLLALGRDFSDVSPIYGAFLSSGAQGT